MATRGEGPEVWGRSPEAAPSSGGHLPPDVDPTGPLFDPLTSPLPSDPAPTRGWEKLDAPPETRPEDGPRPRHAAGAAPARTRQRPPERVGARPRRPRTPLRRVKRTLRHVDPFSVLKVSLFFYLVLLVIWLIIVAILYSFLRSLGLFDQIEEIRRGLVVGNEEFTITLGLIEKWAFLIGLTLAVVGSVINLFFAFLYNAIADAVGGIEMTFVERDV